MKILKWLAITLGVLVLVIGIGIAALVYLVDWNNFRDTIQNQVKKQTGRDLEIAGDLSPSVFPWAGISIGEIALANADGFGDQPFARIGSADVKVEVLPLLKRVVNVRTVELQGLELDLQRAVDGTTNWDDLLESTSSTTTSGEGSDGDEVTTEVEGSSATIAALEVGGIEITDANVSWTDAQAGTDATLTDFDLVTGAIELAEPFDLSIDFDVASDSMDLAAAIDGKGEVTIDLESQSYSLADFTLNTRAEGSALPGGALEATLGADVLAALGENRIAVSELTLAALGIDLAGAAEVTNLDTEPSVTASLASAEPFSPRELMSLLGIEPPVTADESVLSSATLALALAATPASAALNDLEITLDDTTFSGEASMPDLAATGLPPLRFDFAVDAIDVDRYLPPPSETDEAASEDAPAEDVPVGDGTIALPTELLRQLDVLGTFRVGSVKVANLTTRDIVVPVKAAGGRLAVENLEAALYEGQLDATASLDASGATPGYGMRMTLDGIQADPLLADLLEKDSFLSGAGRVTADITTGGDSVEAIKAGLNGTFATAFTDGSINGVNIAQTLRKAKAAITRQSIPEEEAVQKTDFTALSVGGRFDDGVMTSDDLDLRSPLLRVNGAGTVDLPGEAVDYTGTVLVTGSAQGQGGGDLDSLKGVKLDVPIQGTFDELAANFAGVVLNGIKNNIAGNISGQAKALAEQEAARLKAQAQEQADRLRAEGEAQLEAREAELRQQAEEAASEVQDKAKDKLKGLLGR